MNNEFKEKNIFIREIKKEDVKDLYDFLDNIDDKTKEIFHPHSFNMNTITEICNSIKDHYFLMFLNENLIGYSFLRLFNTQIPSFGIIIKKTHSGKGYGTFLTDWTVEKARQLGYDKVILKTYKNNIVAKKIYEKIGFKIIGETKDKKQYKMEKIM